MAWCEANRVDYLFGLARNARLAAMIESELAAAKAAAEASGKPARRFKEFSWTTLDSWSRERRVIAKAEWTQGEANPRFVVTSLSREEARARRLYEKVYCARGDMENRIKDCQTDLFADRTSTATMRANQLRLWFAGFAYILLCAVRRIGLKRTQFAKAQLRNHPSQAAQDRRARARLGPPHQARHALILPEPARIQDRPRPARRGGALTNQTAHSPHKLEIAPPIQRRPPHARNSRHNAFFPFEALPAAIAANDGPSAIGL